MKSPYQNPPPTLTVLHNCRRFPGTLRLLITAVAALVVVLASGRLVADEKAERIKAVTEKITAFEYPGVKPYQTYYDQRIAQIILITPDDFAKVDEWYREAL